MSGHEISVHTWQVSIYVFNKPVALNVIPHLLGVTALVVLLDMTMDFTDCNLASHITLKRANRCGTRMDS